MDGDVVLEAGAAPPRRPAEPAVVVQPEVRAAQRPPASVPRGSSVAVCPVAASGASNVWCGQSTAAAEKIGGALACRGSSSGAS